VLIQIAPITRLALATTATLALAAGVATLIIAIGLTKRIRYPDRVALILMGAAGAVPLLAAIGIIVSKTVGRLGYSWAMNNDAVWNLVVARFVIDDGGVRGDLHANPSPMSPGLIALVSSIGRAAIVPERLIAHDVSRAAEMWLVMALIGALLAGIVCTTACRALPLLPRAIIAILGSFVPLSVFTLGNSFSFGFYNSTVALTLLLATWLLWVEGKQAPFATLGFLSLSLVSLLATWGPLAIVVVPLLIAAFVIALRGQELSRPASIWGAAGGVLLSIAYGLFITLPDLLVQASALANNGGIFALSPARSAFYIGGLGAILILSAVVSNDRRMIFGVAGLLSSSAAGVVFLLIMRDVDGESLWGYYPTKFSWLVISFMIVPAIAALGTLMARIPLRGRHIVTVAGAGAAVAGLLFLTSGGAVTRPALPIEDLIRGNPGVAGHDQAARALFEIIEPGRVSLASRLGEPGADRFVNHWSLQLEADADDDPIRWWAYFLDPASDTDVCGAVSDATEPVAVFTTDSGLRGSLECAENADVVVIGDMRP
jgi:hypothetical protein